MRGALGKTGECARDTLDPPRPKRGRGATVPGRRVAIYHLHVKNISRRGGRSAVAAAAYRAGETLWNEAEEKETAFGGKRDVIFTEIRVPPGAPDWMTDRTKLWNGVETAETRKDSRLAKEIEFALPEELNRSAWIEAVRRIADIYVAKGHVVDMAIHDDPAARNPHAHMMLTTRTITPNGFGLKMRAADDLAFVTEARQTWETIANEALGKAGSSAQIDARSYAARGIDKAPTTHRGPDPATRRERRWRKPDMEHDILEARRELLAERNVRDRFPLLAGRPDWPPERRDPVPGLNRTEAAEWRGFWHEVDKRAWGDELHPQDEGRTTSGDHVIVESRDPVAMRDALRKIADEVTRQGDMRMATLEDALPVWRELHEAMRERMRADGHSTDHPLDDWARVEKHLRESEQMMTRLEHAEAERRALEPVPDPDGNSISTRTLDDAQDRVLFEARRPARDVPRTPQPQRMPATMRSDAIAAVDRQNQIDVSDRDADAYRLAPHENRLDWLRDQTNPEAVVQQGEDRLDWLGNAPSKEWRRDERDRDRDR